MRTTRRTFLGALSAAVAAGSARAEDCAKAQRVKGPRVWLDMDQAELDDAYDQAVYAPNRDIIIKRCARNSELVEV